MREMIFRGKRIDNGEWVQGDLVHDAFNGAGAVIKTGIRIPLCYPIEVLPETVGQYTGLKDKNGKELFDGDIVKNGTMGEFVVTPLDRGSFGIKGVGKRYADREYIISALITDFEIIGNAHDKEAK